MGFVLFLENILENSCHILFLDLMRSPFVPTTTATSRLLSLKKISMIFLQDGRFYITVVRTISAAVFTGTTIFVLKGQHRHGIFTDELLRYKGCALDSNIIMTKTHS